MDLEILKGDFSLTKIPAKLELNLKTKKRKGYHHLFESFLTNRNKFYNSH